LQPWIFDWGRAVNWINGSFEPAKLLAYASPINDDSDLAEKIAPNPVVP
jgi:hypothetical protein